MTHNHDPHHVAHLAAVLLSGRPEVPEAHHIAAGVSAARALLDGACRQADVVEDEDQAVPAEAPDAKGVQTTEVKASS